VTLSSPLVMAMDGGGTKTTLAFANSAGKIVFRKQGASSNPMDNVNWRSNLFASAGSLAAEATHAVFGFPRFGEIARFDESMSIAATELFSGSFTLKNDVEMALDGAFCDRLGVLLLAGTGSMAMARDAEGKVHCVGGWGDIFGDEGSAYWIGREALSNASQAVDGRLKAPAFAQAILQGLGLDSLNDHQALMGWCYESKHVRSAVAGVAPLVDSLARSGDPIALSILSRAADHLSAHLDTLLNRANASYGRRWSFAGGVFESAVVASNLESRHGKAQPPRLIPVAGGLWRAAKEAMWPIDEAWIATLAESSVRRPTGSTAPS
jgi:N-acetylglucosamine kinase-like BadF-type ATPase